MSEVFKIKTNPQLSQHLDNMHQVRRQRRNQRRAAARDRGRHPRGRAGAAWFEKPFNSEYMMLMPPRNRNFSLYHSLSLQPGVICFEIAGWNF